MSKVLTIKRADLATLMDVLPPTYEVRENPVNIVGPMPVGFYSLPTELVERAAAEKDNTRLQVIPYVTLIDGKRNAVFAYTRGPKGAEDRLHGKVSLGLGDHIELAPTSWMSLVHLVTNEALRELNEEVGLTLNAIGADQLLAGIANHSMIIFSESDEVGTVHVGVGIFLAIDSASLGGEEYDVITKSQWKTLDEIRQDVETEAYELEHWSRLTFMQLLRMTAQPAPTEETAPAETTGNPPGEAPDELTEELSSEVPPDTPVADGISSENSAAEVVAEEASPGSVETVPAD